MSIRMVLVSHRRLGKKKKKKKPYTATETETAMPIGKKNKVLRDQLACICHVVVKEPSNIHCGLHWWLR